jgi:putative DNA primase/helicase
MLAALITLVLRPICGITPLFVITKPSPGEGASLLVDIVSLVCTGNKASVKDANSKDNDEWRKTLISLLRTGTPIVNFDNLSQNSKFESPVIAAFLTANRFQDRILGQSAMADLNNNLCCFLTGRNVRLAGDIPRRSVLIEMAALDRHLLQNPSERNFRHSNIKEWITDNRGKLVSAIFTMIKAGMVAGKPSSEKIPLIGSFEDWCSMVGGILEYAEIPGFLGNRQTVYDEMDTEINEWSAFAEALNKLTEDFPGNWLTARELLDLIMLSEDLQEVIPSEMEKAIKEKNIRSLGKILQSQKNVPLDGGFVIRTTKDNHTKGSVYKIEKIY